jgi:hypothetical protein
MVIINLVVRANHQYVSVCAGAAGYTALFVSKAHIFFQSRPPAPSVLYILIVSASLSPKY